MKKSSPVTTVDAYIKLHPPKVQAALQKVRKLIKSVAPKAEECISYQIPAYKYHGMLVGFAAFKNHCGFYVMSPAAMKGFEEDLKPYYTATATIHFTDDKPLPASLIKKIVVARMKENEARLLAKNMAMKSKPKASK